MNCDLCGNRQEPFYKGRVEGVDLVLCEQCTSTAENVTPYRLPPTQTQATEKSKKTALTEHKEIIQTITLHYASLIKQARERQGITQEDYAKRIAEKTSVIHALESGKHVPSLNLARKLEKTLGITLIEQQELLSGAEAPARSSAMTIADLMKK